MKTKTDITALLEKMLTQTNNFDTVIIKNFEAKQLVVAFETERQRAAGSEEELHKALHREKAAERKLLAAQEEIAELKGDQVPVAWRYRTTDLKGNLNQGWVFSDEDSLLGLYQPLFTSPQKPVVHPDTKRMDWLCAHVVEVRQPLFYGSHAMFYGQCDSDDCEEYHSKLREQVDAAIEAAGGWFCTSDERMMQDMSGIAVEQHFREISNSSTKHFRENAETSTNCPKCGGCGSYHCLQVCGTVECECGAVKTEDKHAKP